MILRSLFIFCIFCEVSVAAGNAPSPTTQEQATQPDVTECDRLAGYPYPNEHSIGVQFEKIDPQVAIPACEAAVTSQPSSSRQLLNLGRAKSAAKQYQAAFELFTRAADLGNTQAMGLLGNIYLFAQGVPEDDAKAIGWFQKAADLGDVLSMVAMGASFENAKGNPRDYQLAMIWYRRAADLGYARAMAEIGYLYFEGKGVARDYAQAKLWSEQAANLGDVEAMRNLGTMYYWGQGIEKSIDQAMGWWRRAADLGDRKAMVKVGSLYGLGRGVPKNYAEAMVWMRKAAALGEPEAMIVIADFYWRALGVPQDYVQAFDWYTKAAALGADPINIAELLGKKESYKGITKNADVAADSTIKSLKMHNQLIFESLTKRWDEWTDDFHRAFQKRLQVEGLYSGPIDGIWSAELEIAIEKLVGESHPVVAPD